MDRVWQVGVVVRDLNRAVEAFTDLMPVKEPPLFNRVGRSLSSDECNTVYKGDTKSMASCTTCCFQFDNIEIEFIEPYGDAPSECKNFLDEHGEGIHHLGFKIQDLQKTRETMHSKGYEEVQSGSWGEGEYHYYDTRKALGFALELMLFYK